MRRTKIRVGISFVLMTVVMIIGHQFLLLINLLMALILHEMGHIYVAKSRGYSTNIIKFDMLGANIKLDAKIQKDDLFNIAFAGPCVNFIICILCTSLWWILPETYAFSAEFFRCNLMLAGFNMLPVEPLDGGKMLDSILTKHSRHLAKVVSNVINIIAIALFLTLFVISCFYKFDLTYLLFAIFFASNLLPKRKTNFDLYYKLFFKKNKKIEKINFLHVQPMCTLLEMLKQTKEGYYTIFYLEVNSPVYITEQEFHQILTQYSLTDTISEVVIKQNPPKTTT